MYFVEPSLARGIPGGAFFFGTGFRLPSLGAWLLEVSAGGNWGCFLYDDRRFVR
jgi:hypothetical protein